MAVRHDDTRTAADSAVLGRRERQVLLALLENRGRVVSRTGISEAAGLQDLSARRCDSVLVNLRRRLPAAAIVTVRKRGWVLRAEYATQARRLLTGAD